jgi:hypothetical protein
VHGADRGGALDGRGLDAHPIADNAGHPEPGRLEAVDVDLVAEPQLTSGGHQEAPFR